MKMSGKHIHIKLVNPNHKIVCNVNINVLMYYRIFFTLIVEKIYAVFCGFYMPVAARTDKKH